MPLTEAQKRAQKNYRAKNEQKCRELLYKWRKEHIEVYKEKNTEYVRAFRRRQLAKKEFEELCSMNLF
jgi:hypothetical protein